jgi:hypothetical protein
MTWPAPLVAVKCDGTERVVELEIQDSSALCTSQNVGGVLDDSSFSPQEMTFKLKRDMKIMYKIFSIFYLFQ